MTDRLLSVLESTQATQLARYPRNQYIIITDHECVAVTHEFEGVSRSQPESNPLSF